MKFRMILAVLMAFAVCGLYGCNNGNDEDSGNNVLVLNNYGSYPLVELYITPTSSDSWGVNQLDYAVYTDEQYILGEIPDGCYDMQVYDVDGYYAEIYDICLSGEEEFTWNIWDAKSQNKNATAGEIIGTTEGPIEPTTGKVANSKFILVP